MTRTRSRFGCRSLRCAVLAIGLLLAQFAYAQVNLSFSNVDIGEVAKAIGAATDSTIIVDPRVKGQLNLASDNPVSKERALKTLEAALRMQGFALPRATDPGRIADAKALIAQLDAPTRVPGNMHVVRLQNADAAELAKVLRGMLGLSGEPSTGSDKSGSKGFSDGNGGTSNKSGSGSNASTGTPGLQQGIPAAQGVFDLQRMTRPAPDRASAAASAAAAAADDTGVPASGADRRADMTGLSISSGVLPGISPGVSPAGSPRTQP